MSFCTEVKDKLLVYKNKDICCSAVEFLALKDTEGQAAGYGAKRRTALTADGADAPQAADAWQPCCKRAYIRGFFLAGAHITNPEKAYHTEFSCKTAKQAQFLTQLLDSFGITAKTLVRKDSVAVYIKDAEAISDLLKIIGADDAVIALESVRVERDYNNNVNRRANCDTANFDKTASASAKMVIDIQYIIEKRGANYLPPPLRELAMLRLQYTEASLSELGEKLRPAVSKSAVNHRMRAISRIAAQLRG